MSLLNIPSTLTDPNYRYKMPRLHAKIEGRGNGIKTAIVNMSDIAKALKRPPEYCTKFCGCELGALSKFDSVEGKAIVNGAHTEMVLQEIIDKFIDKFVLCPNCALPEADLHVSKGRVRAKCNACGFSGDSDNLHKVATYILKYPPSSIDSTMGKSGKNGDGAGGKASRAERRAAKIAAANAARGGNGSDDGETEADGNDNTVSDEKEGKEAKEGKKKEKKSRGGDDEKKSSSKKDKKKSKDKEGGSEGDRKEGKKSSHSKDKDKGKDKDHHLSSKSHGKKRGDGADDENDLEGLTALDFDSEEIVQVISRLHAFLTKGSGGVPATPRDFFQETRLLQVAQDFSAELRVFVALESLFQNEALTKATLTANAPYLKAVCDRSVDGETFLCAFDAFVHRRLIASAKPKFDDDHKDDNNHKNDNNDEEEKNKVMDGDKFDGGKSETAFAAMKAELPHVLMELYNRDFVQEAALKSHYDLASFDAESNPATASAASSATSSGTASTTTSAAASASLASQVNAGAEGVLTRSGSSTPPTSSSSKATGTSEAVAMAARSEVLSLARPFFEWIVQAESESDSDSESESKSEEENDEGKGDDDDEEGDGASATKRQGSRDSQASSQSSSD